MRDALHSYRAKPLLVTTGKAQVEKERGETVKSLVSAAMFGSTTHHQGTTDPSVSAASF
jgi:hypothetical protein